MSQVEAKAILRKKRKVFFFFFFSARDLNWVQLFWGANWRHSCFKCVNVFAEQFYFDEYNLKVIEENDQN